MKNLTLLLCLCHLLSCASKQVTIKENKIKNFNLYTLNNPKNIGKTYSNQDIQIGGFSALSFQEKKNGEYYFKTITDRGPNGYIINNDRPFLLPEFSPSILTIKTNSNGELEVVDELNLKKKNGKPLTGLPNKRSEENPVDVFGFPYSIDPDGLDTESLISDDEGGYWIGEEYAPSIVHFSADGKMNRRLMPAFELPRLYMERKTNRGFEGLTKIQNKLFGMLQSPLPIDKDFSRIVEFDLETFKTSAEYFYKFEKGMDKIGDLTALPDGSMLVIEQNGKTGKDSLKKIFRITLNKSDDFVNKSLVSDLNDTPLKDEEKIEGIAYIDSNKFALIIDNDFNISDKTDFKNGITPMGNIKSKLLVIELENNL